MHAMWWSLWGWIGLCISPRGSRSKALANDYRHTYCVCIIWAIVPAIQISYLNLILVILLKVIGQDTHRQQRSHEKTRRKTIMMLMLVVAVFSVCWLPLNLYHVLTDFYPDPDFLGYSSRAFVTCHWIAMSSVCLNPVIYFWLNESFRKEVLLSWHTIIYHMYMCTGQTYMESLLCNVALR